MLTLDKSELQKLQTDVIKNPDRYISMFNKPEPPKVDYIYNHDSRARPEMKFHVNTLWWKMYNDYLVPMDTWPYKQQFDMYEAWASKVEAKAIDTLRNCIS